MHQSLKNMGVRKANKKGAEAPFEIGKTVTLI
jgi:hypothetical protein